MCGIAGFTRFFDATGDISSLLKMGDKIAHRGPDAHGEYLDDGIGLCHRRLSIIDLSTAGNQPMFSQDGNLVIVFNGEIYNYLELRKDLEKKGYQFKTKTDTEVILALYQFEGPSCLDKLFGMFAIALWDKCKQELFLARDRLGKKPLYYYQDQKRFIFGSEIKAILEIESVPKDIRPDAIYDFFVYQYVPESKSIFKNIEKLKPGHYLTINKNGIDIKQYWDVSFKEQSTSNEKEIADGLLDVIDVCTKQRMISDVPLGAFLSGGVDSSGIVALMANNSEKPVVTCSIGFDSKKYDEVQYAQQVADQYQTTHHELTVKENILDHLEHIVGFFDEPFADQSLVPTYFVSQLAKTKVTVALAGDGGDENFAGYSKYSVDKIENDLRTKVPDVIRNNLFPPFVKPLQHSSVRTFNRAATLLNAMSKSPAEGFYLTNTFMTDSMWNRLANDNLKREVDGYHPSTQSMQFYNDADADDHLSRVLYTDIKTYLVGDILVKVDRMSMANSLEVRAPILDHRVVEYAASIPSSLKLNQKEKKYILKKTFSQLLPPDILYRKKMGFSVPLAHWLRHELKSTVEEKLFQVENGLSNYFKPEEIKKIWLEHQQEIKDHSSAIWSLLMFEFWWQKYAS
ncbi:MAG: asparagine synthase (glutamine-hydrolyzing) [Gammaproteobacteria bacterium]|nr:asparagine synthase (glutamine-hydrolyzing) [Gammaproteobacteria bacterium]